MWWAAVASGALGYFRAGVFGYESSPAPAVLILMGALALGGIVIARRESAIGVAGSDDTDA